MHRANQRALAAFLLLSLYLLSGTRAEAGSLNVTAMTQNLYVGADTTPILTATTLSELQTAITVAAQSVIDNNFPKRAAAIAAEAASVGGPLLIGLQEAEIVSGPAGTLNYADTMVAALAARGLNYTYKIAGVGPAVHTGFSLNSAAAGLPGVFSLTDQEVVLVRTGVPGFAVASVSAPTFVNNVSVHSPVLGSIPLDRGYVLVNATLDGVPIQFVSTHLDETHSQAEPAEAAEILAALGNSGEPQLVVGDFNAGPNDSCGGLPCGPAEMLSAGFVDTAAAVGALGPTCCQLASLDNTASTLNKQYDYIFERNFTSINSAFLIGNTPFENVRPLWPSDHAGVVATVDVPEPASLTVFATVLIGLAVFYRRRVAG